MGSGNDLLLFDGDVDVPIHLNAGRDFVWMFDPESNYHITDFDSQQDHLLAGRP